jgi:hypothetical protein
MLRLFLSLILFFAITTAFAQQHVFVYGNDSITCYYTLTEGKFTGKYKSFYKKGIKRSEGELVNGYRSGRWKVWDTKGIIKMERVYHTPFDFVRIIPPPPKDTAAALLFTDSYKLAKDSNGIFTYANIKAENTLWRHKYWRMVERKNNKNIFDDDLLLHAIKKQVKNSGAVIYDTIDDRFTTPLINSDWQIDGKLEMLSLLIKEECFFELNRMCFECRIIGICPIVEYGGKKLKFGWLYYPDYRKGFGKENLKGTKNNTAVKTLDDLFVLRHFSSVIIKSTVDNPYDLHIANYPGMTKAFITGEKLKQEINIIEEEHAIWLQLTKQ